MRSIAFSRDGTRLASASEDGTVRLWDVGRQAPVGKPLEGHAGWVLSVAFSPDGRTLASGGADWTVRLWDVGHRVALGRPLYGHDEYWVESVAFDPRGGRLVSGADDSTVQLWDPVLTTADFPAWQRRLCAIAGRNLTPAEWREFLPDEPYRKTCPQLG